jgi:glucan phosphorylase
VVNDPERPVQYQLPGKAHPDDDPGSAPSSRLQPFEQTAARMRLGIRPRHVLVEDYDINVGRYPVQGVNNRWLVGRAA